MNVATVAAELAEKLETITGPELRVYPYPPDQLAAPAAIVGYPQTINFDVSAGRGQDHIVFPVFVVVDRTWDRASAEQLAGLTAGAGPRAVKEVLQTKPHTSFSVARVRSVDHTVISVAGVEYWVATFLVDIYGPGA